MNTSQLKRFAREARIKLLDQIGRKLEFVLTHDTAELRGKEKEITQLRNKINQIGKEQLVEMVAYTWFNRIMALRFMDSNGYTIQKVVTPLPGMTNPEILQNALGGNIDSGLNLDRQRLNDLFDGRTASADAHTEAYKMLLVAACNSWHSVMPFMFERINDYTELLLPDDLLSDYSIVADIRNGMSDEDCRQEELLGWLYQFYISDKKDEVFAALKKNVKISAENIPAATQLFTPRWIVRFMVENTLGKLWITLRPNSKLKEHMPYLIEALEDIAQEPVPKGIKYVTDITFLDPCQGSGHILVYAFELFTKIYEEEGYNNNEIPALILRHNLFGIDIDERATQLAAFALSMKAHSYYSRFLRNPVHPHIKSLNNINQEILQQVIKLPITVCGRKILEHKNLSLQMLTQAENFGSLIHIDQEEVDAIQIQQGSIWEEQQTKLKEQAEYLSRLYHCVVTNPPYKGKGELNSKLQDFMESRYPKSKGDLFACFIERGLDFAEKFGLNGMVTMQAWLFIDTYKDLRAEILDKHSIRDLIQIGFNSFPELNSKFALAAAFTIKKGLPGMNGNFMSLNNAPKNADKCTIFFDQKNASNIYRVNSSSFKYIEGTPISFEASENLRKVFHTSQGLRDIAEPRQGMATGDNDRFVRIWHEVSFNKIGLNYQNRKQAQESQKKWFPYNKGGGFRKYYGNQIFIVNWENDGKELFDSRPKAVIRNPDYYFRECISWSLIGLTFGPRYTPSGFLFDVGGSSAFPSKDNMSYILGFMASKVSSECLLSLNPTLNYQVGDIQRLPIKYPSNNLVKLEIEELSKRNIEISKEDWDRQEISWDFSTNSLLKFKSHKLKSNYDEFCQYWKMQFENTFNNESRLNQLFIETYQLEGEIEPVSDLKHITILDEISIINNDNLEFNAEEIIKEFISYSVGCVLGRYSLNKHGLILANQGENLQNFLRYVPDPTILPDEDNIIPVLEEEWFTDDIEGSFKVFLRDALGIENFQENLKFIEDTIGKDIRKYFVKDFYNDHIQRYKKRPIYWMFTSPKGYFKALIYMHRYQPDLCSKMLNDYLFPFISKLEAKKLSETSLSLREDISSREKNTALKEIDKLEAMLKDCREYEKTLFKIATQKIQIDLDDGVKVNYQKFQDVLVPIKGLEKEEE